MGLHADLNRIVRKAGDGLGLPFADASAAPRSVPALLPGAPSPPPLPLYTERPAFGGAAEQIQRT